MKAAARGVPLGRMGAAGEVTGAALFLALPPRATSPDRSSSLTEAAVRSADMRQISLQSPPISDVLTLGIALSTLQMPHIIDPRTKNEMSGLTQIDLDSHLYWNSIHGISAYMLDQLI